MTLQEAHIVHHEDRLQEFSTAGAWLVTRIIIVASGFLAAAAIARLFV